MSTNESPEPLKTPAHRPAQEFWHATAKHVAFALALILDELARHMRDLDEQLRGRVLDCCRSMLGDLQSSG
jgi:hypothetical protein